MCGGEIDPPTPNSGSSTPSIRNAAVRVCGVRRALVTVLVSSFACVMTVCFSWFLHFISSSRCVFLGVGRAGGDDSCRRRVASLLAYVSVSFHSSCFSFLVSHFSFSRAWARNCRRTPTVSQIVVFPSLLAAPSWTYRLSLRFFSFFFSFSHRHRVVGVVVLVNPIGRLSVCLPVCLLIL